MKQDIKQLFEEFVQECEYSARLSEVTIRGYRSAFDLLVKMIPEIALDMITPAIMTRFFSKLQNRKRTVGRGYTKVGIKKSTVATYRGKLGSFFKWLEVREHIAENPFNKMKYPKVEYVDIKFLRKEQVEAIMTAITFHIEWKNSLIRKRNLTLIAVPLYCGLRKGELIRLKLLDLDFERKTLTVRAENSKSRRDRVIPMNRFVVRILQDYLGERKKAQYLCPQLFVSNHGDLSFTLSGLKHTVDDMVKGSGQKFSMHQLRHTFAVNMIDKGCDIAKLQQLMGHKDIRQTAVYLRCLPTKVMKADVEKLNLDDLV